MRRITNIEIMKKYLITIMTLALVIAGHAQSHQKAKALLEESSAKMKSYQNLYIEFDYNFENTRVDPPVTQEETGNIAIKGDDYHLKFLGTEQIRSGNKLYTILEADMEVQVTEYDSTMDEQGLTPTRILSLYQDGYSYGMGESKMVDGQKIQFVTLNPIASEEVEKIEIGINTETKMVHSLKQWGTNGTITHFTVTKIVPNKNFESNYFSFDRSQYSDYYIAD